MWEEFGVLDHGEQVWKKTIENDHLRISMINYGATIVEFYVKALDRYIDLGYQTLQDYVVHGGQLGATVGPVANRIGGASYEWNGKTVQLEPNNGPNLLHSGQANWGHRTWKAVDEDSHTSNSTMINMCLEVSEDDGFPSVRTVCLHAYLQGNAIHLDYTYKAKEDSFINLTNHIYFNLHDEGTIENHIVQLDCETYMPFGDNQIPTGVEATVQGTAFDFRDPQQLGPMLETYKDELAPYGGYDHDFVKKTKSERIGSITGKDIRLTVSSNLPHVQLYTGNWLDVQGRNRYYGKWAGLCLEPQFMPDDINKRKESRIQGGQEYSAHIVYAVELL